MILGAMSPFLVKRSGKKQRQLVLITMVTTLLLFQMVGPSSVRTLYLY